MASSFGLCTQSSDQNNYKNINAGVYNVLFVIYTLRRVAFYQNTAVQFNSKTQRNLLVIIIIYFEVTIYLLIIYSAFV